MNPTLAIGYAGMTHLGLNSSAAAAEKGFAVTGYDPDPELIAALNRGDLPVSEPDLTETVARNRERLSFTADAARLSACDLVYVAPDVPTDDHGGSDLSGITGLISEVRAALSDDAVLVVLSQVPPGFTRALAGSGARVFYQVETLIFGRAVERALRPERFIVGCADPGAPLPDALGLFLAAFDCPVLPMRYESAELAKIAINCCLVSSISVANTLSELCEEIGADWSEITPALRLDKRIGQHAYIAPGLGIAGGNLERDLATVRRLADAAGTDTRVVRAWADNSAHRRDWVLSRLHETVLSSPAPVIAVLGLAYKQDTHSTKNSPALALIAGLRAFALRAFDPLVAAQPAWHPNLFGAASALDACDGADAVAIMTPWRAFGELDPKEIAGKLRGHTLIDPFGVLDAARCAAAGLSHIVLGRPRG